MFGLSFTHLILLALLALIFIGPEELPQLARTLGRFLNEVRRGGESFRDDLARSSRELRDEVKIDPPDLKIKLPSDPPAEESNKPKDEA